MKKKDVFIPSKEELESELEREKYKIKYRKAIFSTLSFIVVIVAISSIISMYLFPILKIHGTSMNPTLYQDDTVLCINKSKFDYGDIIAFYYNNKILVKRVVGLSSDWINIDEEGNVYVNDNLLEESYIDEKAYGESDILYPYQVSEGSYFVLGDDRLSSFDSRSSKIGVISKEDIIGKVIFRLWPINRNILIK